MPHLNITHKRLVLSYQAILHKGLLSLRELCNSPFPLHRMKPVPFLEAKTETYLSKSHQQIVYLHIRLTLLCPEPGSIIILGKTSQYGALALYLYLCGSCYNSSAVLIQAKSGSRICQKESYIAPLWLTLHKAKCRSINTF